MTAQAASRTKSGHVAPCVAEADSRFSRNYSGVLASAGFAAFLLVSAPVLAQVLGTASSFAVLAGSTVTNTASPTLVTGNVGVWAGAAITGFPPGSIVPGTGTLHFADPVAQQAQADNTTAYGALAGLGPPVVIGPALDDISRGGLPLNPGIYNAGAANLTGILHLTVPGLYVFKTGAGLTTAAGPGASSVDLNGISPCDLWWTVPSSATIGTGTVMAGNILASTSISVGTGATLQGRVLAQTGQVSLDANAVTACAGGATAGFTVPFVPAAGVVVGGGIPTLSEWTMIMLAALLAIAGLAAMVWKAK